MIIIIIIISIITIIGIIIHYERVAEVTLAPNEGNYQKN